MISLQMDMVQYDCPYIDTTVEHDVSFSAKQWDFNTARELLETRIMVRGADRGALDNALTTLGTHDNMRGYDLIKREGEVALIRSRIGQTDAMRVIRDRDGYITGPFEIADGSETWHVGFDRQSTADGALSALSRNNDFSVESRDSMDLEEYSDLMRNVGAATTLLNACRDLSAVERETLRTAVSDGYFTTPRDATLSTLAEEFDVSKMAVSKNLRRGQRKLLGRVTEAMDDLDAEDA
ncbi:helix-turn-helix domain-containing protein [Halobaculum magnesiiphilum]|uniref:Helix-turn-helix domain-containing protein n=1 Tax=Halobaculum magnesiiphilum TaxID=1017351 RepID=A0A8T8WEN6_9EURY|nr:helix-turn-helix domain-containing protein [Halobaculum magnesiiphilum]QZP38332.1 helix-turn-helix domain-containing protein [Halobaculum magnesiiphilum]